MHFRNNLFLGRDTPDRGIMTLGERHRRVSAPTTTASAPTRESPSNTLAGPHNRADACMSPTRQTGRPFQRWPSFEPPHQEAHGVEVDFDILKRLAPPDPANRHAVYHAMDLNFR